MAWFNITGITGVSGIVDKVVVDVVVGVEVMLVVGAAVISKIYLVFFLHVSFFIEFIAKKNHRKHNASIKN